MSNKTQLQTNNTKYASLIETLRGKAAGGGGEDVTEETTAYTTKIGELETAVAALESELEGKASGGSGGVQTASVTVSALNGTTFHYVGIDGLMEIQNISTVVEMVVPSICVGNASVGYSLSNQVSGNAEIFISSLGFIVIDITGNATITIDGMHQGGN